MKFWDSSAVIPLLISEEQSERLQELVSADRAMIVWWATRVECVAGLSSREREGTLSATSFHDALRRLNALARVWDEVQPSALLREFAERFLRVHPLRAADALQLAAAFIAAENRPVTLEVVALDDRLVTAASREGFVVVQ